jgi:glycosyltransferase involved in cell wall biosynthesis
LTLDNNSSDKGSPFAAKRPKVLFLVTEDRFFWSHRLPVARAGLRDGYEVIVATGVSGFAQQILDEGFRLIPLKLVRKSNSLRGEVSAILQLRQIYRREKPDIVHHVAIKPILYGSIASLGRKSMPVMNALTGLGYLVGSSSWQAAFLRVLVWRAFRLFLNRPNQRVLVENEDDKRLLIAQVNVSSDKIVLTRGSGVDVTQFGLTAEPTGTPVILLAARMLWIKGVEEFVEAAKLLRAKGVAARFVLAGDTDLNNPTCVPRRQLLEWQNSGIVEWWGHQQDMPNLFKQVNLVCLPSHGGEGVPKVLMEAAACGRAIVTTDVPGCREIVRQGVNGFIVPPKNASLLASAMEHLLNDSAIRRQMAARSREIAVDEFSEGAVVRQTLALYSELLNPRPLSIEPTAHTAAQV